MKDNKQPKQKMKDLQSKKVSQKPVQSHLRIRFLGEVDQRLRPEVLALTRWLREWYDFPVPCEIRLRDVSKIIDRDKTPCSLRFWRSTGRREPFKGELAVGSFTKTLKREGPTVAYPTVIAAIGRLVKYYFQSITNAPLREDYATAWGDKLLDAYVAGSYPPQQGNKVKKYKSI